MRRVTKGHRRLSGVRYRRLLPFGQSPGRVLSSYHSDQLDGLLPLVRERFVYRYQSRAVHYVCSAVVYRPAASRGLGLEFGEMMKRGVAPRLRLWVV
jgi:hypothetical protein